MRYVKWDFRGYKIVINHQTNILTYTHAHVDIYIQNDINIYAGMSKIKLQEKEEGNERKNAFDARHAISSKYLTIQTFK